MIRVGIGQDSHPFTTEEKICVLGGIEIEDVPGFVGNSDGDVIVHALCAAIEQALGRKNFSTYSDVMCKEGITDSKEYLKVAVKHMKEMECTVNNVGISVECKMPKILPIEEKIKKTLAPILETDIANIGINATTGEGMTAFGRGEGVQAFVIISLQKPKN
ncbi:MAG: 2-C-methyl-D-erythritol 2,4-cyclodiphosphate synthase [Candidatus Moraniibacteriota bacterium]|nr:MAG: 2-C-methyl-D-erythritol 2,4-cyclodiphosphate synthase [Candidatus Moranbacteria bacterium]